MRYLAVKEPRCPRCGRRRRSTHFERRAVECFGGAENQIEVERAARIDKLIEICMSLLPQLRTRFEEEMLEALRAQRVESLEHERAMMVEAGRQARIEKLLETGLEMLPQMPRKPRKNRKDGERR